VLYVEEYFLESYLQVFLDVHEFINLLYFTYVKEFVFCDLFADGGS
jgi:hypothetical protein